MTGPDLHEEPAHDLSVPVSPPYSIGVYLAINAIPDAHLLMDSPRCAYNRIPFVQGNHDWFSDLDAPPQPPRITNTALTTSTVVAARHGQTTELLRELASRPDVGVVFLGAMPMTLLTSPDYGRMTREASGAGAPVVAVPYRPVESDWLDGYAGAIEALATQVDLTGGSPRPGAVAIVGYLLDRNEGDHAGNLRELERLVAGLGLELVSTWLDGSPFERLRLVRDAEVILSLPYARAAAKVLARRTRARLVEVELPLGLAATERFVGELARAMGREAQASALLDRELRRVVPRLEPVTTQRLMKRRVGYVGDPHMLGGVVDLLALVGCDVPFAVVTCQASHLASSRLARPSPEPVASPTRRSLERLVREEIEAGRVDALVTNSAGALFEGVGIVELGFPSYFTHALHERPFLGFGGALVIVEALANELGRVEARRALSCQRREAAGREPQRAQ